MTDVLATVTRPVPVLIIRTDLTANQIHSVPGVARTVQHESVIVVLFNQGTDLDKVIDALERLEAAQEPPEEDV